MFRLLFVILLAVAMLIGCDGVKRLDWKKTAEDQGLKLGQKIRVDAVVSEMVPYNLFEDFDFEYETHFVHKQVDWKIVITFWAYDPTTKKGEFDPLRPISIVVCKMHNASHDETMLAIREAYPKVVETTEEIPYLEHNVEIVGYIKGFERKLLTLEGKKPLSLRAVHIEVERLMIK